MQKDMISPATLCTNDDANNKATLSKVPESLNFYLHSRVIVTGAIDVHSVLQNISFLLGFWKKWVEVKNCSVEVTTLWWIWSQSLFMLKVGTKCRCMSLTKTRELVNPLWNLNNLDGMSLLSAVSKAVSKKEHTETVKAANQLLHRQSEFATLRSRVSTWCIRTKVLCISQYRGLSFCMIPPMFGSNYTSFVNKHNFTKDI